MNRSRQEKVAFGVLLALAAAARLMMLWVPTQRDEGMFGYVAQEILRGHLPLVTVADSKGPFFYFEYALGLALFGETSIAGIRVIGLAFVLAFLVAYERLARSMGERQFPLLASALMVFTLCLARLEAFYYGTELFILAPLTLCAYYCWKTRTDPRGRLALVAGIFLGLAIWSKITMVVFGGCFGGFLLYAHRGRQRIRLSAFFTAGVILVSLVFLSLYAWQGQLPILREAFFTFSAVQATIGDAFISSSQQLLFLGGNAFWSLASLGLLTFAGLLRWRSLPRDTAVFLFLWLGVALFGFLAPMHYSLKQLYLVYPPCCFWAAIALQGLFDNCRPAGKRSASALISIVILAGGFFIAAGLNIRESFATLRDEPTISTPQILHEGERVASWIRDRTKPGDTIYNWGVEWELYLRSGRPAPTRHVSLLFLVSLAVAIERGAPLTQEFVSIQAEIERAFSKAPPKFFILTGGVKDYGDLTMSCRATSRTCFTQTIHSSCTKSPTGFYKEMTQ